MSRRLHARREAKTRQDSLVKKRVDGHGNFGRCRAGKAAA